MSAVARADADENGPDRTFLLASGATAAATGLALVVAEDTEQSVDEFLSAPEKAAERRAAEGGAKLNALPVIRALLADPSEGGRSARGDLRPRPGKFFDLILELAHFTATCITIRQARSGTPVAATLAHSEEMLVEFVEA
ncbi:hypothetical protein [Streptomyces herbicida]|uniref:hypothetical protein n=1 Tax=Streptomyces herbicida TaxID=3065675 RepID=UPI002931E628|nr:hypothetical protein [Streptomyces sp. NEAU-HV9]